MELPPRQRSSLSTSSTTLSESDVLGHGVLPEINTIDREDGERIRQFLRAIDRERSYHRQTKRTMPDWTLRRDREDTRSISLHESVWQKAMPQVWDPSFLLGSETQLGSRSSSVVGRLPPDLAGAGSSTGSGGRTPANGSTRRQQRHTQRHQHHHRHRSETDDGSATSDDSEGPSRHTRALLEASISSALRNLLKQSDDPEGSTHRTSASSRRQPPPTSSPRGPKKRSEADEDRTDDDDEDDSGSRSRDRRRDKTGGPSQAGGRRRRHERSDRKHSLFSGSDDGGDANAGTDTPPRSTERKRQDRERREGEKRVVSGPHRRDEGDDEHPSHQWERGRRSHTGSSSSSSSSYSSGDQPFNSRSPTRKGAFPAYRFDDRDAEHETRPGSSASPSGSSSRQRRGEKNQNNRKGSGAEGGQESSTPSTTTTARDREGRNSDRKKPTRKDGDEGRGRDERGDVSSTSTTSGGKKKPFHRDSASSTCSSSSSLSERRRAAGEATLEKGKKEAYASGGSSSSRSASTRRPSSAEANGEYYAEGKGRVTSTAAEKKRKYRKEDPLETESGRKGKDTRRETEYEWTKHDPRRPNPEKGKTKDGAAHHQHRRRGSSASSRSSSSDAEEALRSDALDKTPEKDAKTTVKRKGRREEDRDAAGDGATNESGDAKDDTQSRSGMKRDEKKNSKRTADRRRPQPAQLSASLSSNIATTSSSSTSGDRGRQGSAKASSTGKGKTTTSGGSGRTRQEERAVNHLRRKNQGESFGGQSGTPQSPSTPHTSPTQESSTARPAKKRQSSASSATGSPSASPPSRRSPNASTRRGGGDQSGGHPSSHRRTPPSPSGKQKPSHKKKPPHNDRGSSSTTSTSLSLETSPPFPPPEEEEEDHHHRYQQQQQQQTASSGTSQKNSGRRHDDAHPPSHSPSPSPSPAGSPSPAAPEKKGPRRPGDQAGSHSGPPGSGAGSSLRSSTHGDHSQRSGRSPNSSSSPRLEEIMHLTIENEKDGHAAGHRGKKGGDKDQDKDHRGGGWAGRDGQQGLPSSKETNENYKKELVGGGSGSGRQPRRTTITSPRDEDRERGSSRSGRRGGRPHRDEPTRDSSSPPAAEEDRGHLGRHTHTRYPSVGFTPWGVHPNSVHTSDDDLEYRAEVGEDGNQVRRGKAPQPSRGGRRSSQGKGGRYQNAMEDDDGVDREDPSDGCSRFPSLQEMEAQYARNQHLLNERAAIEAIRRDVERLTSEVRQMQPKAEQLLRDDPAAVAVPPLQMLDAGAAAAEWMAAAGIIPAAVLETGDPPLFLVPMDHGASGAGGGGGETNLREASPNSSGSGGNGLSTEGEGEGGVLGNPLDQGPRVFEQGVTTPTTEAERQEMEALRREIAALSREVREDLMQRAAWLSTSTSAATTPLHQSLVHQSSTHEQDASGTASASVKQAPSPLPPNISSEVAAALLSVKQQVMESGFGTNQNILGVLQALLQTLNDDGESSSNSSGSSEDSGGPGAGGLLKRDPARSAKRKSTRPHPYMAEIKAALRQLRDEFNEVRQKGIETWEKMEKQLAEDEAQHRERLQQLQETLTKEEAHRRERKRKHQKKNKKGNRKSASSTTRSRGKNSPHGNGYQSQRDSGRSHRSTPTAPLSSAHRRSGRRSGSRSDSEGGSGRHKEPKLSNSPRRRGASHIERKAENDHASPVDDGGGGGPSHRTKKSLHNNVVLLAGPSDSAPGYVSRRDLLPRYPTAEDGVGEVAGLTRTAAGDSARHTPRSSSAIPIPAGPQFRWERGGVPVPDGVWVRRPLSLRLDGDREKNEEENRGGLLFFDEPHSTTTTRTPSAMAHQTTPRSHNDDKYTEEAEHHNREGTLGRIADDTPAVQVAHAPSQTLPPRSTPPALRYVALEQKPKSSAVLDTVSEGEEEDRREEEILTGRAGGGSTAAPTTGRPSVSEIDVAAGVESSHSGPLPQQCFSPPVAVEEDVLTAQSSFVSVDSVDSFTPSRVKRRRHRAGVGDSTTSSVASKAAEEDENDGEASHGLNRLASSTSAPQIIQLKRATVGSTLASPSLSVRPDSMLEQENWQEDSYAGSESGALLSRETSQPHLPQVVRVPSRASPAMSARPPSVSAKSLSEKSIHPREETEEQQQQQSEEEEEDASLETGSYPGRRSQSSVPKVVRLHRLPSRRSPALSSTTPGESSIHGTETLREDSVPGYEETGGSEVLLSPQLSQFPQLTSVQQLPTRSTSSGVLWERTAGSMSPSQIVKEIMCEDLTEGENVKASTSLSRPSQYPQPVNLERVPSYPSPGASVRPESVPSRVLEEEAQEVDSIRAQESGAHIPSIQRVPSRVSPGASVRPESVPSRVLEEEAQEVSVDFSLHSLNSAPLFDAVKPSSQNDMPSPTAPGSVSTTHYRTAEEDSPPFIEKDEEEEEDEEEEGQGEVSTSHTHTNREGRESSNDNPTRLRHQPSSSSLAALPRLQQVPSRGMMTMPAHSLQSFDGNTISAPSQSNSYAGAGGGLSAASSLPSQLSGSPRQTHVHRLLSPSSASGMSSWYPECLEAAHVQEDPYEETSESFRDMNPSSQLLPDNNARTANEARVSPPFTEPEVFSEQLSSSSNIYGGGGNPLSSRHSGQPHSSASQSEINQGQTSLKQNVPRTADEVDRLKKELEALHAELQGVEAQIQENHKQQNDLIQGHELHAKRLVLKRQRRQSEKQLNKVYKRRKSLSSREERSLMEEVERAAERKKNASREFAQHEKVLESLHNARLTPPDAPVRQLPEELKAQEQVLEATQKALAEAEWEWEEAKKALSAYRRRMRAVQRRKSSISRGSGGGSNSAPGSSGGKPPLPGSRIPNTTMSPLTRDPSDEYHQDIGDRRRSSSRRESRSGSGNFPASHSTIVKVDHEARGLQKQIEDIDMALAQVEDELEKDETYQENRRALGVEEENLQHTKEELESSIEALCRALGLNPALFMRTSSRQSFASSASNSVSYYMYYGVSPPSSSSTPTPSLSVHSPNTPVTLEVPPSDGKAFPHVGDPQCSILSNVSSIPAPLEEGNRLNSYSASLTDRHGENATDTPPTEGKGSLTPSHGVHTPTPSEPSSSASASACVSAPIASSPPPTLRPTPTGTPHPPLGRPPLRPVYTATSSVPSVSSTDSSDTQPPTVQPSIVSSPNYQKNTTSTPSTPVRTHGAAGSGQGSGSPDPTAPPSQPSPTPTTISQPPPSTTATPSVPDEEGREITAQPSPGSTVSSEPPTGGPRGLSEGVIWVFPPDEGREENPEVAALCHGERPPAPETVPHDIPSSTSSSSDATTFVVRRAADGSSYYYPPGQPRSGYPPRPSRSPSSRSPNGNAAGGGTPSAELTMWVDAPSGLIGESSSSNSN